VSDDDRDAMLDAYLDGQLEPAGRRAFELELERDPALRALLELQTHVDASVARVAAPPDADAILARARAQAQPEGRVVRGPWARTTIALLAASVLVALGLGLAVVGDRVDGRRDMAAVYDARVAAGFKPDWVCRDAAEFEATFTGRLGQPVRPTAAMPPGVKLLGLGYDAALSPETMVVLVEVEGSPVLVFVDRRTADRAVELSEVAPLRLFRREASGLVLYEVSPLDAPRALEALELP
jgi:anti-sigma factor RsiW